MITIRQIIWINGIVILLFSAYLAFIRPELIRTQDPINDTIIDTIYLPEIIKDSVVINGVKYIRHLDKNDTITRRSDLK